MARRENFFLDTRGGAYVLQVMAKDLVHNTAQKIATSAQKMSGAVSGHKANLKVVGSIEGIGGKPDAHAPCDCAHNCQRCRQVIANSDDVLRERPLDITAGIIVNRR